MAHCLVVPSAGPQSIATPPPETCTYNVDRFKTQDVLDDGAINGRLPTDASTPLPDSLVPFYEARTASTIAAFDVVFGTGASHK